MTVAWLGIVACQIGTAFTVRTDHAPLRQAGVLSSKPLLAVIAVALTFAAAVVYAQPLHSFFGTAALTPASSPRSRRSRSSSGVPTNSGACSSDAASDD